MAENNSCSSVPVSIKLESCESASCTTVTNALKCTCGLDKSSEKCTTSESKCIVSSRQSSESRDVLVNFGLNRKKIITMRNEDDDLQTLFSAYMQQEPAFSKLLDDSYVVFQEFNAKFDTWVDVDECKNLTDGAAVKAVFFPKMIEREDSDPSSVKQTKHRNSITQTKEHNMKSIKQTNNQIMGKSAKQEKILLKTVYEEKKILEIDLSSDSDNGNKADKSLDETTRKTKKSKHKEKKKKRNQMVSDDESSSPKNETELEKSKRRKKKRHITAEEESDTSGRSEDNVTESPDSEHAPYSSENASASQMSPKQYPYRMPVSIESSLHLKQRQWNKTNESFHGDTHWKRKENVQTLAPRSLLGDALSRSKSFGVERTSFRSTHHYKIGCNIG